MKQALLVAALLATPLAAFAQGLGQGNNPQREPNMTNPQAQTNERANPPNAHQVTSGPGAGEAKAIPTPTLGNPMTPINKTN